MTRWLGRRRAAAPSTKRHTHSYHGGAGGAEALRQLHRTLIDLRGRVWGDRHGQDTFLEIDQDQDGAFRIKLHTTPSRKGFWREP